MRIRWSAETNVSQEHLRHEALTKMSVRHMPRRSELSWPQFEQSRKISVVMASVPKCDGTGTGSSAVERIQFIGRTFRQCHRWAIEVGLYIALVDPVR